MPVPLFKTHLSSEVSLWILIGLPGSGKSTWGHLLSQHYPDLRLIATDQIRAWLYGDAAIQGDWLEIWGWVQHYLRSSVATIQANQRVGVIYDATNTRRRARRDLVTLARDMGYTRVLGFWFDVPLECCLWRNQQRSRQVPPEVIRQMARQLAGAPPDWREGFDAIVRLTN